MQKGYPVRGSPRIYLAGFRLQQPQSAGAAGRLWGLRCRAQIGSAQDRGQKVLVLESCCPVARYGRDGYDAVTTHAPLVPRYMR